MIVIFIYCFYLNGRETRNLELPPLKLIVVYCLVAATKIIRIKISIQLILDMPFKVRIKEWRTFASWHWETGDEKQCGICRNPFDAICGTGDCNQPGDKCPMISGKCGHKFHYHCIRKWLSVSSKSATGSHGPKLTGTKRFGPILGWASK